MYQFSFCKVLKICLLKSNCKLTKLWFPHSLIYRDGLHVSLINKRESWHSSELLHAHNHQAKLVRKEGGSCASTLHSTTGHHTHPLHLLSCQHISISPTPCNFSAIQSASPIHCSFHCYSQGCSSDPNGKKSAGQDKHLSPIPTYF